MQGKLIRKKIGNGAFMNSVTEPKFKSDRISLCLVTPIKKETATVNALVPFVLRKGCRSCPDFTKLNKKLFKCLLMIFSVLICHIAGVIQFCVVSGNNIWVSFISASLPFLFKDLILVFLAEYTARKINI